LSRSVNEGTAGFVDAEADVVVAAAAAATTTTLFRLIGLFL